MQGVGMPVIYCDKCCKMIDLDYDVNHELECGAV